MTSIVIKFVFRGANVTWFVNDNWIAPISFLLTLLTGKVFKFIKSKMSSEKVKMPNPKGGHLSMSASNQILFMNW
jgi:hypothetical protein